MEDKNKVYYFKGMSTDLKELELIKEFFLKKSISMLPVYYSNSELYYKSLEKILDLLKNNIELNNNGSSIDLVCHSMGCNFGLLLANRLDNVNSITFISPEFINSSKEEQKSIELSKNKIKHEPSKHKMNIWDILLFLNSKRAVKHEILEFINKGIKVNIIYSKGDKYVSRKMIEYFKNNTDFNIYEIDCNSHNPILEENESMDIIYTCISASKKTQNVLIKK